MMKLETWLAVVFNLGMAGAFIYFFFNQGQPPWLFVNGVPLLALEFISAVSVLKLGEALKKETGWTWTQKPSNDWFDKLFFQPGHPRIKLFLVLLAGVAVGVIAGNYWLIVFLLVSTLVNFLRFKALKNLRTEGMRVTLSLFFLILTFTAYLFLGLLGASFILAGIALWGVLYFIGLALISVTMSSEGLGA